METMMSWKNTTIGKRTAVGFGMVLILLSVLCLTSLRGIGEIVTNATMVIRGNELDGVLAQIEVDHLNWANKINAFLTDDTIKDLQIETDDHQCQFGKWLYGDGRKQTEALIPSLSPLLKSIEPPHGTLHQSAAEIIKNFRRADTALPGFLAAKETEHLKWVNQINLLFLSNLDELKIETDPQKCNFGQWLYGDGAKALMAKAPELSEVVKTLETLHRQLHESAAEIQQRYKKIHPGLKNTLKDRLDDHHGWAAQVSQRILENQKQLDVETDPTWCELGTLLTSNEAALWISDFPEMRAIIESVQTPHDEFHASFVAIEKALRGGNNAQAANIYTQKTLPALNQIGKNIKTIILKEDQLIEAQTEAKAILNNNTLPIFKKTVEAFKSLRENAENMLAGAKESNRIFAQTSLPALKETQDILQTIRTEARKNIITDGTLLRTTVATKRTVWVIGITAAVSGVFFAFFITRGIIKVMHSISMEMKEGATQVAEASVQVSASSQAIAEGASEQAAFVEETSAAIEEMASKTRHNAENSKEADTLMREAGAIINEAHSAMTTLNQSMGDISTASAETQKIVKTIDEIAFQTNLLALNAAVEAARAGEAGAGFAVVADEVRNLAMRAAQAAKSTADMIEGSIKKIDDGSKLAKETNASFSRVSEATRKIGQLVEEISAASSEQSQSVEETTRAISEMDRVIQKNASSAEETASVAEEMSAQALQMNGNVEALLALVGINGSKDSHTKTYKPRRIADTRSSSGKALPLPKKEDY
jgi:methyl-accepting chemotaxis protein